VFVTDVPAASPQQACKQDERYFKEHPMNQMLRTAAKPARHIRSALSGRGLRAATVAGVMALAVGTAGSALASTASPQIRPHGYAPTEECLNWSGSIQYFPALTTTRHAVTAVLHGTLSNCNFSGTAQTFSGTVFGDLTGTATKSSASLSGNVAVTWPSDANLNPTISPISVSTSSNTYNIVGTIGAGAGTGEQLWASYAKIGQSKVLGGTSESILGSAPFGIFVNFG
jgi:hypothetical protein